MLRWGKKNYVYVMCKKCLYNHFRLHFWLSLSVLIDFPNFRLICSYFVLVTIIIFDLALHICIFIIHADYFRCHDGLISERITRITRSPFAKYTASAMKVVYLCRLFFLKRHLCIKFQLI